MIKVLSRAILVKREKLGKLISRRENGPTVYEDVICKHEMENWPNCGNEEDLLNGAHIHKLRDIQA